nr:receptor-like protein kinase 5 [Physcomitrium patens]|eukprot:XP_024371766.1 receptor-like protein kinase 5 [Physcomitrella patens]
MHQSYILICGERGAFIMAGASGTPESLSEQREILLHGIALFIVLWNSMIPTVHAEVLAPATLNLTLFTMAPTKAFLNSPGQKVSLEVPSISASHLPKFAPAAGRNPDTLLTSPSILSSEYAMNNKGHKLYTTQLLASRGLLVTKMACSMPSTESRYNEGTPSNNLRHRTIVPIVGSLTSYSENSSLGPTLDYPNLDVSPACRVHRLRSQQTLEIFDASANASSVRVILSNMIHQRKYVIEKVGLTGPFPDLWADTNLTTLGLSRNSLEGPKSSNISNLSQSMDLELGSNSTRGKIPSLPEDLIDRSGPEHNINNNNRRSGSVPTNLGNVANAHLDRSNCSFMGTIPASIGRVSELQQLDLSNNSIKSFKLFVYHFLCQLHEFKAVRNAQLCHNATTLPPKIAEVLTLCNVSGLIGGQSVVPRRPPAPAPPPPPYVFPPTQPPYAEAPGPSQQEQISEGARELVLIITGFLVASFCFTIFMFAWKQIFRGGKRGRRIHNDPMLDPVHDNPMDDPVHDNPMNDPVHDNPMNANL